MQTASLSFPKMLSFARPASSMLSNKNIKGKDKEIKKKKRKDTHNKERERRRRRIKGDKRFNGFRKWVPALFFCCFCF